MAAWNIELSMPPRPLPRLEPTSAHVRLTLPRRWPQGPTCRARCRARYRPMSHRVGAREWGGRRGVWRGERDWLMSDHMSELVRPTSSPTWGGDRAMSADVEDWRGRKGTGSCRTQCRSRSNRRRVRQGGGGARSDPMSADEFTGMVVHAKSEREEAREGETSDPLDTGGGLMSDTMSE